MYYKTLKKRKNLKIRALEDIQASHDRMKRRGQVLSNSKRDYFGELEHSYRHVYYLLEYIGNNCEVSNFSILYDVKELHLMENFIMELWNDTTKNDIINSPASREMLNITEFLFQKYKNLQTKEPTI